VTDAEVTVAFFMPAMPTMNMPAMRNDAKLSHAGGGTYRGPGQVMMAGRWEVSVLVSRSGQRIGAHQLTVVAR
ncbi:MAG: FixH family protein, partial [Acidobacteria bacterium]|nr:FixH family protein [Acidobacteriota bacterium]